MAADRRNSAARDPVVHPVGERATGGRLRLAGGVGLGCRRRRGGVPAVPEGDRDGALDLLGSQRGPEQEAGKGQHDEQRE